jgi:hypothetical protein
MAKRRNRLPKGSYPLPEGGRAIDKDGVPIVVGSGRVRIDPNRLVHPNMQLLARVLLRMAERQLKVQAEPRSPDRTDDQSQRKAS